MTKKKFLFISPHPDDAELGIGGTILKLKKQGHTVFMVDLTDGEPTPFGTKEKRKKETKKATKILKVDERINLDLPNRYLFDNKEARFLVAETIRKYKPDILFCPYPEDAHPDHL
ncbi:MAG: PIG-L family deacetylase, partial [Candidatus Omnitrophica bacterium]|nr:PIG-L family deacetylase [Candidatus Omnitrophota bacterium]MCF7909286.1 PIG-L family deacetylase [Candidatus Omnitrophota bacterium]